MPAPHFLKKLVFLSLAAPCISNAAIFSVIESKPINELWLNPGLYSYHFRKNKGLNDQNFGFGGEYRYSTVSSVTLGRFNNSTRQTSHYAGWYWQPVSLGPVRLGAVVGALDGYPNMRHGGWYFAVIPTASIEYKNFGANVLFVPDYQDKVYGSISVQLKLKVF